MNTNTEEEQKIMPPPGLPIKKKIALKRGYLDPGEDKKNHYKIDDGVEWIKKWRKRF